MIWCLSVHAGYRCRHAGACCRTDWEIPVEPVVYRRLRDAGGSGGLAVAEAGAPDGTARLRRDADGTCLFFDRTSSLCAIHRDHGVALLPAACRMFPRIVLADARGQFVSLSHYCPTAAAMLMDDTPLSIVRAPSTLVDAGELEGLDASGAWPPLLRPGVLMDLDAYGLWERCVIETLGRATDARRALDRIDGVTRRIAWWSPRTIPLDRAIEEAFGSGAEAPASVDDETLVRLVRKSAHGSPVLEYQRVSVKMNVPFIRWLAARAFGCWVAYQGRGLRTIVLYLRACLAVAAAGLVRGEQDSPAGALEAIRRADLLLLHQADSAALATSLDRFADTR